MTIRTFLALLLLGMGAGSAVAGPPGPATREIRLPWRFAPEQDGAMAAVDHAAGLGFLGRSDSDGIVSGTEFALGGAAGLTGDATFQDGFLSIGALRLGPIGLGIGYGRINEDGEFGDASHRFDLSLGWRVCEELAFGVHWHRLKSNDVPAQDGQRSWSLSTTLRPNRYLSITTSGERLGEQGVSDPGPIVGELGVGIRPGTDRLTLGLEGATGIESSPGWRAGGTLRLMVVPGLTIGGYGRFVRDLAPSTAGSGPGAGDAGDRTQWGGFLELSGEHVALASSVDRVDPASGSGASGTSLSTLVTMSSSQKPSLKRPTGHVARLRIDGRIPESPDKRLLGEGSPAFGYWLAHLDTMANDPELDGVLVDLREAPDWGQAWELRQALNRVRHTGKRIYVRLGWGGMKAMYIASAADRIYLQPAGGLKLLGLSITRTYFAGMLDELGVEAQVVRYEEFKSKPEKWTRTGPSDAAKKQTERLLNTYERAWNAAITSGRDLGADELRELLEKGPQTMEMAHRSGLVDRIVPDDRLEEVIGKDLGKDARIVDDYRPPLRAWRRWGGSRKIAVVPVTGNLVNGEGRKLELPLPFLGDEVGDEDVKATLQQAVRNPRVEGIVVRVDSPGGALMASDRIHRAVQQAAAEKPLVVSFGDVAASGGYYAAAEAPEIMASPLTVTGSIGIFAGKLDLSGLYDHLGLSTSTSKTAPHADAMGYHRPWTDAEKKRARERLGTYYERFLKVVASGRDMEVSEVRELAGGRVFTGARAVETGLVDERGSLWDAVQRVRDKAGIGPDERIALHYARPSGPLISLLDILSRGLQGQEERRAQGLEERLRAWLATLESLAAGKVQARMPWSIDIR